MNVPSAPIYLRVDATFKPDGVIVPTTIYWTDGRPFTVDKVLDVRPGASLKHGGAGLCYKVRISNKERQLFLVGTKWFVEDRS